MQRRCCCPPDKLAPDFFFHPQIYRQDGETVLLPPGTYSVDYTRGPEYLLQSRTITVPQSKTHKESFQLEREGDRIFVNVPDAGEIALVDRKTRSVVGAWRLDDAKANFPMALDERDHRLFVATRRPGALLVYDTGSGKRIARLPIAGDADDLFFDAARRRVYVVCGEGKIEVIEQRDADRYQAATSVPTARGARTGLYSPERSELFVAVPARSTNTAEIRVYRVQ